jgi:hypothetical protein
MKNTILIALAVTIFSCSNNRNDVATEGSSSINYGASPAKSPSSVPHLFTDKNGEVYLSWVERNDERNEFKFSRLQGDRWSEPKLITAGDSWFVNWADYPMMATDGDKNFVAHILDKSGEGAYAYDVKMLTSSDTGLHWAEPFILHNDGKQAEHGFVSLVPFGDNIFVTWLDGRNTAMEGMDHGKMDEHGHHGTMSLRAALIDYAGNKINEWELDNKTCDCCQTTAVITDNGPVVVYRDRSDDEIRDMSVVRLVDGSWTKPQALFNDNWKISGCPVNGPRASSLGNNMSVAWFAAPDGKATVNVIFSKDGGATFGAPVRVDEGKPNGRVDVTQLDDDACMVSWMERGTIKALKVYADGTKGTSVTIASSSEARSSGFPQMTLAGKEVVFAWTDDKEKLVKVATLAL